LRHRNISKIFEKHFNKISHLLKQLDVDPDSLDISIKSLIGSYFTMEYSIESAAFFNPSVVEHSDQSETGPGEKRVVISFRETGEGHISSIVFRTGVLDKNNNLSVEPVGNMLEEAQHIRKHIYDKASFKSKLDEMKDIHSLIPSGIILDKLNDKFIYGELRECIKEARNTLQPGSYQKFFSPKLCGWPGRTTNLTFRWTQISPNVLYSRFQQTKRMELKMPVL